MNSFEIKEKGKENLKEVEAACHVTEFCYYKISFTVAWCSQKRMCWVNCSEPALRGLNLLSGLGVLSTLCLDRIITSDRPDNSILQCDTHDFLDVFKFLCAVAVNLIERRTHESVEEKRKWLPAKAAIQYWTAKSLGKYRKIIINREVRHPEARLALMKEIAVTMPRLVKKLLKLDSDFGLIMTALIDCKGRSDGYNDFYFRLGPDAYKCFDMLSTLQSSTERIPLVWGDSELVDMIQEYRILSSKYY